MNFKIEVVLSSVFVVMMVVLSGIPAAEAQMTRLSYRSASTGPRMDRRRILSASVHTLEWRSELTLSQGERVSQFSHTFMDRRYGFKLKF